jgi:hypothetical protein
MVLAEFVAIAQPRDVPPPSFEVGGYRDDGTLTRAPLLLAGRAEHYNVRVSFTAPLDGTCGLAQVVDRESTAMMRMLHVSAVHRGEVQLVEAELGNAAELAQKGVTSSAATVVVVCFIPETPNATRYSHIFRTDATLQAS